MRFSIVVTCHNQRAFIVDAVESALSQSFSGAEIIVVDDGSNDGSTAVLEQYKSAVRLALQPASQGAIAARNLGASLARGEYLVFLDGDDALMPWALEVYDRVIAKHHPMLILGRRKWCEGSIPKTKGDDAPTNIEFVKYDTPMLKDRSIGLGASTFVVLRQAFEEVGNWTPGIFHLDLQDLVTKLAYSGGMVLMCAPFTAFYRIHSGNSIHTVRPFLHSLYRLMAKEKAGEYPGGPEHRFDRSAWLGGLVAYWVRRALSAGLYAEGLALACRGSSMILAGVARKSVTWVTRRQRPIETIEF